MTGAARGEGNLAGMSKHSSISHYFGKAADWCEAELFATLRDRIRPTNQETKWLNFRKLMENMTRSRTDESSEHA
jgi:hypothetical protein